MNTLSRILNLIIGISIFIMFLILLFNLQNNFLTLIRNEMLIITFFTTLFCFVNLLGLASDK